MLIEDNILQMITTTIAQEIIKKMGIKLNIKIIGILISSSLRELWRVFVFPQLNQNL